MRIAVDAMGGDFAPAVVIEAVADALREIPDVDIHLVGHQQKLAHYLLKAKLKESDRLHFVHAEEVVEMSDLSTAAIRSKRHSSITVAAGLVAEKKADGVISAGHTGAAVAATKVRMRMAPGVDRPAIATLMPAIGGRFVLTDAGANTDCDPLNLAQFAVMGELYAKFALGIENPRVGLLSVGGEDVKGNSLTKEAFKILSKMPINFVGNVEGNDMFHRVADVVVCDGFNGNVALKTAEGIAGAIGTWLKEALTKDAVRQVGAFLAQNAFRDLKAISNSEEYGGAPLLGINGVCIIGHGASSPKAVKNAIRVANEFAKHSLPEKIAARIQECNVAVGVKTAASKTDS
ncbi:MAG: phosphate acyltransferase PlsX [Lentisphaeria bacterium]|nr:phosphate acyltransferase PlsX [Lentisphaeria bacterium]